MSKLLKDKTTCNNIIWATDLYENLGSDYEKTKEIKPELITGNNEVIKNRFSKEIEKQNDRTKKHAEVFTPLWICNQMNNTLDENWFGSPISLNKDNYFPGNNNWKKYINSRRLEITCGEAPFLVSRYDSAIGNYINVKDRTGLLDRKLRIISENTETEEDWFKWTYRAFESIYGYEFQGDNVLIARINLLKTFEEYLEYYWKRKPTQKEYQKIINIIVFNIWQMDGLTSLPPYKANKEESIQISFFDNLLIKDNKESLDKTTYCLIKDWRKEKKILFNDLKESEMKFDYIIGNPPYQEETESDSTRKPPVYHKFMEESYKIADVVELITPARFLFNAGYTPADFNKRMLNDSHFKVLTYGANSADFFSNVEIKGGIAISIYDNNKNFGKIGTFTPYKEMTSVLNKVKTDKTFDSIIYPALSYKLSKKMKEDFPNSLHRLRTSAFSKLSEIFLKERPSDNYIKMIGLLNNKRVFRYVNLNYLKVPDNFENFKIILPKSNGNGVFGEIFSKPFIGEPKLAHTQTFISIGNFKTKEEAQNCLNYLKTKFLRSLLGILKTTQDNPRPKWKLIPLQDFTENSDIDWTKSIPEIDQQLYQKYGLSQEEINFIETNVKEME